MYLSKFITKPFQSFCSHICIVLTFLSDCIQEIITYSLQQTSKAAEEVCILPLAMIPVEIEPTIQDLVNEYFKAEALVGDDSV